MKKNSLLLLFILFFISFSAFSQWTRTSADTTNIINLNSGFVGIGMVPSTKLDVTSPSGTSQVNIARFNNSTNGHYTSLSAAGSSSVVPSWSDGSQILEMVTGTGAKGIVSSYQSPLVFQTGRYDRMTIDMNGRVGIGVTSPTSSLDVAGGGRFSNATGDGNTLILSNSFNSGPDTPATQAIYLGYGGGVNYSSRIVQQSMVTNHYGSNLIFQVHSTETSGSYTNALTLKEDGSGMFYGAVGIGTTASGVMLDVSGTGRLSNSTEGVNALTLNNNVNNGLNVPSNQAIYLGLNGGANYSSRIIQQSLPTNHYGSKLIFQVHGTSMSSSYKNALILNEDGSGSFNGSLGVGTAAPADAAMAVNGIIHSKEVSVDLTGWPDYVFKPTYQLPSLSFVKNYIDQNQHLPDMPSEQELLKTGLKIGQMENILTKKVEELTLYLIEKDQQMGEQKAQIEDQKKQIAQQEERLKKLEALLINKD